VTMSLSAYLLAPPAARVPVLLAIVVWGLAAWSYFPAQQARLIGVAGVKLASVVLSLNASFMFAGFALGAVLGSATIAHGSPAALGFVGAASILAGLVLVLAITREKEYCGWRRAAETWLSGGNDAPHPAAFEGLAVGVDASELKAVQ
jgi:predicted MFS family arabinose efflux permease